MKCGYFLDTVNGRIDIRIASTPNFASALMRFISKKIGKTF